jgi:hypothetical protein
MQKYKIQKYLTKLKNCNNTSKQQLYFGKLKYYNEQMGGAIHDANIDPDLLNSLKEIITNKDFIIVGAGPVGLITAYSLFKELKEGSNIYIFEKRKTNTREQIVLLDNLFWNSLPNEIKSKIHISGGLCYANASSNIICDSVSNYDKTTKKVFVKLNVLQDSMIDYFTAMERIVVVYVNNDFNIDFIRALKSNNIIFSDGTGKEALSAKLVPDRHTIHVSYAIVITFECKLNMNSSKGSDKMSYIDKYQKLMNGQHEIISYVTRTYNTAGQKDTYAFDASLSGYVGMQLSKDTYNTYNEYLKSNNSPQNEKFTYFTENFPEGKICNFIINELYKDVAIHNVNMFDITLSCATEFYKREGDKYYFMVGDSAFTTHFFTGTGLNRGLASSKILTSLLADYTFNREFLATLYTISQKKSIVKLWGEIIPQFILDTSEIIKYCNQSPNSGVTELTNCVFGESKTRESVRSIQLKEYVDNNFRKEYDNFVAIIGSFEESVDNIATLLDTPIVETIKASDPQRMKREVTSYPFGNTIGPLLEELQALQASGKVVLHKNFSQIEHVLPAEEQN